MNVTKTAAAFGHFTAADPEDETLFDRIIAPDGTESDTFDDAKQQIIRRYQLNEDEFTLFREWCLKIVDVNATLPRTVRGADVNMATVATCFLALFGMDGNSAFADIVESTSTNAVTHNDAVHIFKKLTQGEANLFKALCETVADHVDYESL